MIREMKSTNNRALVKQINWIKNRILRQLGNGQSRSVLTILERAEGDRVQFSHEVNALVTKSLMIQLVNKLTGDIIPVDKTDFINAYSANVGHDLFTSLPQYGAGPIPPVVHDDDPLDLVALIDRWSIVSKVDRYLLNIDRLHRSLRIQLQCRVDSPLSDARCQCKCDPFSVSCGSFNTPHRAIIKIHIERGVLE